MTAQTQTLKKEIKKKKHSIFCGVMLSRDRAIIRS
jgi:hypothetical protein